MGYSEVTITAAGDETVPLVPASRTFDYNVAFAASAAAAVEAEAVSVVAAAVAAVGVAG